MNETKTCENELLTLRPASMGTLEDWIIETIRLEDQGTPKQEILGDDDLPFGEFGDEFNEEIKLLAEKMSENVLKHTLKQREPLARVQPRKKKSKRVSTQLAKFFVPNVATVLLLAFVVGIAYHFWQQPKHNGVGSGIAEKLQTPAVIVDVADVKWNGNAPKLGEPLMPGTLAFESGTVELLFFNGVRSVIEGPADLTLLNEGRVFCNNGKWSVMVPPSGVGFEIQTSQGTIRDLGTQFFAAIDDKKLDVHVLKGAVELKDSTGKTTLFKTNQAGLARVGEKLVRLATAPENFVTKTEMRQRSDDYLLRNPPPVMERTEPVLSVDFSQENPQGVTIFSGKREEGTFYFTDGASRIRLQSLGQLSSFTVLIHVRVDQLKTSNNPILMSEGSKSNGLIWAVSRDGSILFGCRRSGTNRMVHTPIVFTKEQFGEWAQLGLTFDGKQMSVYLNGDVICAEKLPSGGSVDWSAMDVGNWKLKSNVGQLDGAVRSIVVFDRVLEITEIRTL